MCWILLGIFYFFCFFFPSIPAWSVSVSNFGRSLLNLSLFVLLHLEVTLGISELMAASVGRVLSICLSYLNPTGIRKLAFSLSDSSLAAGLFLLYQSDTSRRIKMERWELECCFFFVCFSGHGIVTVSVVSPCPVWWRASQQAVSHLFLTRTDCSDGFLTSCK